MPLFHPSLTDETLERVSRECPGWDVYALKGEFDIWLADNNTRQRDDYQAAFHGSPGATMLKTAMPDSVPPGIPNLPKNTAATGLHTAVERILFV
jgi:hypothetical protein